MFSCSIVCFREGSWFRAGCQWHLATALLDAMRQTHQRVSRITLNSVMSACEKAGLNDSEESAKVGQEPAGHGLDHPWNGFFGAHAWEGF